VSVPVFPETVTVAPLEYDAASTGTLPDSLVLPLYVTEYALTSPDVPQVGTVNVTIAECGVTFWLLCQMPSQSARIANTRSA
jgi:hypothetical protein